MAKLCLYCGQPLAKEDARFCNECGHVQDSFSTSSANATAASSRPAMIRVKLPPKELLPEENPFAQPGKNQPNQTPVGTARAPQRESSIPPSARLPKRPVRLTTQESAATKEPSSKQNEPGTPTRSAGKLNETPNPIRNSGKLGEASDAPALPSSTARPETAVPKTSAAEEESTMVLSGWREELERVRKEQAATRDATQTLAKPAATENQPLKPAATTEKAQNKPSADSSPVKQPRPSSIADKDELAWPHSSQAARTEIREKPGQLQNPPQKNVSEPGQNTQETVREKAQPAEQPRRELHVRVWEQEPTVQLPHIPVSKEKPGPAPAVEHTPFANVAFDAEKQAEQIAQVETIHWEALPTTPAPSSKSQEATARVEPIHREAPPQTPVPATRSQDFSTQAETVRWELPPQTPTPDPEKTALIQPKEKRPPQTEGKQSLTGEKQPGEDDIENLPTAHLAIPESVQIKPGITVERTSTPAPSAWTAPSSDEVEDQPTRPMPASALAPRSPLPPTAPQRDQQSRSGVPATASNPASLPGLSASPTQTPNAFGAEGARGQASNSHAPTFDPASLPPLPLNPAAQSGTSQPGFGPSSTSQRSEEGYGQRAASSGSSWPGTPSTTKAEESKQRKKKPVSGKKISITIAALIILGVGGWFAYYQFSSGGAQPYQPFTNTGLGVSLSYPQGWKVTVNKGQTSAHFADSNQTEQVTLSMAATNGQQISQYLAHESTQLGITGTPKTTTLTFGGASWQEVKSNVVQQGVTYTLTLYVAEHNGHFYALVLQAPPTAYAQIEQEDFQALRSSFSFL